MKDGRKAKLKIESRLRYFSFDLNKITELSLEKKTIFSTIILAIGLFLFNANPAIAQQRVTNFTTRNIPATPTDVNTTVADPCDGYPGCTSDGINTNDPAVTLQFGRGNDIEVVNITAGGKIYEFTLLVDRIFLRRKNNPNVTGQRQVLFYQTLGNSDTEIAPPQVLTQEEGLLNEILNRGSDNFFSNTGNLTGANNFNNIERADFVISAGITINNINQLNDIGFLISERGGNDSFKIAAITAIDAVGNPTSFGPVIAISPDPVTNAPWGQTGPSIRTIVTRQEETETTARPSTIVNNQTISGIFFSLADLGANVGDTVFGYALFANDLPNNVTSNDLLNINSNIIYPNNTNQGPQQGGLDLIAGGGIFINQGTTLPAQISGRILQNGLGIGNITVELLDNNGNVVASTISLADGNYTFNANNLVNGNYSVRVFDPPLGQIQNLDPDGTLDSETVINFIGNSITNLDFGYDNPPAPPNIACSVALSRFDWGAGVTEQNYDPPGLVNTDLSLENAIVRVNDASNGVNLVGIPNGGIIDTPDDAARFTGASLGISAGGIGEESLVISVDPPVLNNANDTSPVTFQYRFTNGQKSDVRFAIIDLDTRAIDIATSVDGRIDRVTVVGFAGTTRVNPILIPANSTQATYSISGNIATATPVGVNSGSGNAQNFGTLNVYFPQPIDRFEITYEEVVGIYYGTATDNGTPRNPGRRAIAIGDIQLCGTQLPQLLLVKRITAINGNNNITSNGQNLSQYNDDPGDPNDNSTLNWPTPLNTYLRGAFNIAQIQPGDEIEYTLYFLSSGGQIARNVRICDLIPEATTFLEDGFGIDRGIALFNSTVFPLPNPPIATNLTNNPGDDRGQLFIAGSASIPAFCTGDTANNTSIAGAVVVNLNDLPSANAAGNPPNSYGFIRFKVRVK